MTAMYVIPVTPFTLDLIQSLNGEVRPHIEEKPTYFIFSPQGHNLIIKDEEYKRWAATDDRKPITIHVI